MSAATLVDWLASTRDASSACVVEGPAGIGKSYLIDELVARASEWRVLRARPAEAEVRLVGSALLDLCADVTDAELAELPPALGAVLSVALVRDSGQGETAPHAVAAAFHALIRQLSAATPVLICVDDIQWLDAETAQVLLFAARRLPESRAAILAGLRTGPQLGEPQVVTDLCAGLANTRLTVEPMPPETLSSVIRDRAGQTMPESAVRAAVDAAAGNPLFGIEVARSLMRDPGTSTPEQVRVPASLLQLVGQHIQKLDDPTRELLAAASALRKPSVRELRDLGVSAPLAAAEHAGLIRTVGHEIEFTHPLYAAAAYDALAGIERMHLHARLAQVVEGEEERARHLALGAEEPDEDVALALDRARDRALARGALHAATDACRLGLLATPADSPARPDRLISYGVLLYRVGDTALARLQLTEAVETARESTVKARALLELGRIVNDTEGTISGAPITLEALSLAGDDLELLADIHVALGTTHAFDWLAALDYARRGMKLTDEIPDVDPRKVAAALAAYVGVAFYAGEGAQFELCRRAIELEAGTVNIPVSDRAVAVLPFLCLWTDDFTNARAHLAAAYQLAVDESDEPSRGYLLSLMAQVELRAGNWTTAELHIQECRELFRRTGNGYLAWVADQAQLWLDVYRGQYDAALASAEKDIANGVAADDPLIELRGRGMRGFCLLAQGDAASAADELDRYRALFAVNNAAEPALRQLAGDHIEALVLAGRLTDARVALDELLAPATQLGRTAVLAAAARSEALLHAAQGDADEAVAAATRSLALYDEVERRFDRARALLTRGQIHRRFKHKSAALKDLSAAFDQFTALGADAFARRAAEERDRIGIRRVETSTGLTETERKVAELTAQGLTASEVGGRMFLSPKTVSANLTVIYRKLGVRNRAELIAQFRA